MDKAEESTGHSYTHIKKETFLEAFREKGTIKHSYEASGVCRQTIYNWLADDEVFKRDFADAKEDFADDLEQELYTRVKDNTIKNKSDLALFCALKGNRREKFGDNLTITPKETLITIKVVRVETIEDYIKLGLLNAPKQLKVGSERDSPAVHEVERITGEG